MRLLKWWKGLLAILVVILLIGWVVPIILLKLSLPNSNANKLTHYLNSYAESRKRFLTYQPALKENWEMVQYRSYRIGSTQLTTDIMWADANQKKENLIVITSGVHGIEGYVGSAMIDLFQQEFISRLDPNTTGLVYVHAVNPWGMKNFRRYNEDNVDLNRNFILNWNDFHTDSNKDYTELRAFFEKNRPLGNSTLHEMGFIGSLGKTAITSGTSKIEKALLTGQYTDPKGVYYGGSKDEPSTEMMKKIYAEIVASDYQNIVHIDLHTGYGPKYQMSIFSSSSETMTEAEAKKAFHYPLVLTPDSKDFYVTSGDNTEYMYGLQKQTKSSKKIYSTTFEFGTLGDGTIASIQSLKNTIDENRLYWQGSTNDVTKEIIKNRYKEMFYPSEEKWRKKAEKDFQQAIKGVLNNREIPLNGG
ncbi:MAG TPA: M14 family metallopeptidase [Neobacillus sp.]